MLVEKDRSAFGGITRGKETAEYEASKEEALLHSQP